MVLLLGIFQSLFDRYSKGCQAIGLFLWLGLFLTQCSVSLENPEADAQKKINEVIPTTVEELIGQWEPDSTYSADDTKATSLVGHGIKFEIFEDSSLVISDPEQMVFSKKIIGRIKLVADTLFLIPSPIYNLPADTFITRVRFLGNRLELENLAEERFSFFHKRKLVDSIYHDSLLGDSLWILQLTQIRPDSIQIEPQLQNFTYFSFHKDSMNRDIHRNGIYQFEPGIFSKQGKIWSRKSGSLETRYYAELMNKDTLRLWPLQNGRPELGFELYTHQKRVHPYDLDLRQIFKYLRCDSISLTNKVIDNHFGQFFDFKILEDHTVKTFTNMPVFSNYQTWTLEKGKLRLEDTNSKHLDLQLDSSNSTKAFLSTDVKSIFDQITKFSMTKIDGTKFIDHPLERFDQASFVQIYIDQDTIQYFFFPNYAKGNPEKFEILEQQILDTSWVTFTILPNQDSYQNGQAGFRFITGGRTSSLGHFTCRVMPKNNFVIRVDLSKDPSQVHGTILGDCQILSSEKPPIDSTLALSGIFRVKRKITSTSLLSPFWNLP